MRPWKPLLDRLSRAQWFLITLTLASTVGGIVYYKLRGDDFMHSAALFLGIPAILAILLALTPGAKTATGAILKGITLALLIAAPLLGEGYLCILMASPLFYLVGVVVGRLVDLNRKRKAATLSCVALLAIPMCLEGVVPQLTWNRAQVVEASEVLSQSTAAVEAALARSPQITRPLPRFLAIGFPRPLTATGSGLALGATRIIHFSGAEGDPAGDLVLRVTDRTPGSVHFEAISDSSKLTQWIRWQSSDVRWQAIDSTHTRVTWRIRFTRELDPIWYFGPWERFAVRQAAQYLITANANPESEVTP